MVSKPVSIVSWNIEGYSVLYDNTVCDYLASFQIAVLVETFATNFPTTLFPNHQCYLSPGVRVSDAPTSRLCGGVSVLAEKTLDDFIERVHVEYDHIVVLKLSKNVLGTINPILLVAVYLPPTGSVYYDNTDIVNGVAILEQCLLDLAEHHPEAEFLIAGDLNSRTANGNYKDMDIVDYGSDDSDVSELVQIGQNRTSKDTGVNDFGRYLLTVCEEFDVSILNGMIPNVSSGNYTYIAFNGSSVVDYFVLSNSLLSLTLNMNVSEKIERKHQPIELILNHEQKTNQAESQPQAKSYKVDKIIWDSDKEADFMTAFDREENVLLLEEACSLIDVNIEQALCRFQEILNTVGSCMKRTLVYGKEKKKNGLTLNVMLHAKM